MNTWQVRGLIARIEHDEVRNLDTVLVRELCYQALGQVAPDACPHCPARLARIRTLEAQVRGLQTELATLEAAARHPAHADPDLAPVLDAVEALRRRLHPGPAVPFPQDLRGRALRPAERRLVEDQIYAWRYPADGSKPPTFKALAERLDIAVERVRALYASAEYRHGVDWRHERGREALTALAAPDAYVTPEPASSWAAADSEA